MCNIDHILKLDLKKHFNAKVIGPIELIQSGKFSNVGMCGTMIVPNTMEVIDEKYRKKFDFSDNYQDHNDNIICEGQVINLSYVKAKKVLALGFGQWIDSCDILTIIYDDGEEEKIPLIMTQGVAYVSRFIHKDLSQSFVEEYKYSQNCSYDLAFLFSRTNGEWVDKIGMNACESPLTNKGKPIKAIRLPDNEFINIFAISIIL